MLRGFLGLGLNQQVDQIHHVEQAASEASSHRGRPPERAVNLDEVVREVINSDSSYVILELQAETMRQARVPAHRRADTPILPFHAAGGDVLRVRLSGCVWRLVTRLL